MTKLTLTSPSKINLILEIKGKRADGFHELKTVMHSLTLSDQLIFNTNNRGLIVTCDHPKVPNGKKNLVFQAVTQVAQTFNIEPQVTIKIKKNIPVAAGMGGGSSNAATALIGLAKLWEIQDHQKLLTIAKSLGSDVPFFLTGGCMLGTGRGERLYPWPSCPGLFLVIINPGLSVSTASIYKKFKFGLTTKKACINMMRQAIVEKNALKIGQYLFNHLALVTENEHPVINNIKDELLSLGATSAMMTGSGPTVFGVVPTEQVARSIAHKLAKRYAYVTVARTSTSRDDELPWVKPQSN